MASRRFLANLHILYPNVVPKLQQPHIILSDYKVFIYNIDVCILFCIYQADENMMSA